jgi:hypothetical protein
MTRRLPLRIAIAAGVVLVAAVAIGFGLGRLLSAPGESPTPSASPSDAASCQVTVTPTTIHVDPSNGSSDDVLFFAGAGFPPNAAIQIDFGATDAVEELETTTGGTFDAAIPASVGTTYPADVEAGPLTWTVHGLPEPGSSPGGSPAAEPSCTAEVTVTVALTAAASPTPPTDLSAGGYAEILADGVRVRVEPSIDATVVGALFTGDVVRILAPAQVVDGLAWYRIESVVTQSGDQVSGYVAAGADGQNFLRPTGEPPPPTPSPSPSASPSASPT